MLSKKKIIRTIHIFISKTQLSTIPPTISELRMNELVQIRFLDSPTRGVSDISKTDKLTNNSI